MVQRLPVLVDDHGQLLKKPNPDYPSKDPAGIDLYIDNDNVAANPFGRRYRVISFRWLNKDEV